MANKNPKDRPTLSLKAAYAPSKLSRERYTFVNHQGVLVDWTANLNKGHDAYVICASMVRQGVFQPGWSLNEDEKVAALLQACNSYARRHVPAPQRKPKLGSVGRDYRENFSERRADGWSH